MMADLHNQSEKAKYERAMAASGDSDNDGDDVAAPKYCTPEDYANDHDILSKALKIRGFYKRLVLPKKHVASELKRRVPLKRVNTNNTKTSKIMELLLQHSLTDNRDIECIKAEFAKIVSAIELEVTGGEDDGLGGPTKLNMTHRLRLLLILIGNDEVLQAFHRSTDFKDKDGVDYRNTEMAQKDWKELLSIEFNESEVEYETKAVPNLHDKFRQPIKCDNDGFVMTPDKCKTIVQDMRTKLRDIIRRYNLSGNGSEMAKHDGDDDGDGGIEETEESYGRFNKDLAIKRARRKGREDLVVIDGDDRASFLKHHPADLLYWWNEMDKLNLIYFIMGKLDDHNSASSAKTPAATSRKRNAGITDTDNGKKSQSQKSKRSNEATLVLQRQMVENVARMGRSVDVLATADIARQIENLEEKKLDHELKLMEVTPAGKRHELLSRRIGQMEENINKLKTMQDDIEIEPKQLDYNNAK